jgi:dTDP-glucose 4,6-dehydratase
MGRVLLVTGGAGFIGANYVHHVLAAHPDDQVVVLDKLTYAGNLENLKSVADDPRYRFVHGDICEAETVARVLDGSGIDAIVNFAAETHVDRSIVEPDAFIRTDVLGTHILLEAARERGLRYHQVSTDEVYGHVADGASVETDPLEPRSPYAASKAGGDLLVNAYFVTYGMPVTISRGSNNIGPYQYPEKVLPLFIGNAIDGESLPVYGDGLQERDYQWVGDHCEAIDLVLREGKAGEAYNIGTGTSITNMEMTRLILECLDKPESLIRHVEDRPGHDRRYCIDTAKIRGLGWHSRHTPQEAIRKTVQWYVENEGWWRPIRSGEFKEYYRKMYGSRGDYQPGSGA